MAQFPIKEMYFSYFLHFLKIFLLLLFSLLNHRRTSGLKTFYTFYVKWSVKNCAPNTRNGIGRESRESLKFKTETAVFTLVFFGKDL